MAIKKPTTSGDVVAPGPLPNGEVNVKVVSPFGALTEVPASIVETLLASGYKKK